MQISVAKEIDTVLLEVVRVQQTNMALSTLHRHYTDEPRIIGVTEDEILLLKSNRSY